MTTKDEALKLALKRAFNLGQTYWQQVDSEYPSHWKKGDVTLASFNQLVEDTIREALAEQPAQQPYGWKVYGVNSLFVGEFAEADAKAEAKRIGGTCIAFPLYTSPPPRKPWIGLTGEEIQTLLSQNRFAVFALVRAIEAKLKEKNA